MDMRDEEPAQCTVSDQDYYTSSIPYTFTLHGAYPLFTVEMISEILDHNLLI